MKILQSFGAVSATALLAMTMSTSASASVTFGNPLQFNGTGCPGRNAVTVVGANSATLSVLFGQYDAGNGKPSASGLGRSACSFAVPINVPSGFQVSHVTVDWETYAEGSGSLGRKFFLAGRPWQPYKVTPLSGNKTVRDNLLHASLAGCRGGRYNMRINSQVKANRGSYVAVDSADLQNKLIFRFRFSRC